MVEEFFRRSLKQQIHLLKFLILSEFILYIRIDIQKKQKTSNGINIRDVRFEEVTLSSVEYRRVMISQLIATSPTNIDPVTFLKIIKYRYSKKLLIKKIELFFKRLNSF